MFIIEDFRHAPMRPLATAETPEEAHATAAALGLGEHAFFRTVKGTMTDAVEAIEEVAQLRLGVDSSCDAKANDDDGDDHSWELSEAQDRIDELEDALNKINKRATFLAKKAKAAVGKLAMVG